MSTQPTIRPRLSFGPFEYDPNLGELKKHRSVLRLQGQPLRLLAILLEQPGELIGRMELQRQLWPGVTSGDIDHGLNAAMNKLRQTLSDSAEQPRYIETVPGQGYRFIAPLHTQNDRPVLALVPARKPTRGLAAYWQIAASVALLILLGAAYWIGSKGKLTAPEQPLQFTVAPPPGYYLEPAAPRQSFALSPDGNFLAFAAMDESGRFYVFLRDLSKLEAKLIPDSRDGRSIFWHPDGKSLYYAHTGKLMRYTIGANSAVIVGDALAVLTRGIPRPDGKVLVSNNLKTALVSSPGTPPEVLPYYFPWPQLLPDGKSILTYTGTSSSFARTGVVKPIDGAGAETSLGKFHSRIDYTASVEDPLRGYLISVQSGILMAQPFDPQSKRTTAPPIALVKNVPAFGTTGSADFSVATSGVLAYQPLLERTQYFWVDRTGKPLEPASRPNLCGRYASISLDGKHIVIEQYDVEAAKSDLRLIDTATQTDRALALPYGNFHGPIWSPDSRSIVYMRSIIVPPKLAIASIDAVPTHVNLPEADFMVPTSWSRDGRYILYDNTGSPLTDSDGQSDIFLVDLKGKPRLLPFIKTPFHESGAAFSPSMKHVAFMSTESGRPELYLQAIEMEPLPHPVGDRRLISKSGALCLRWAPDGKELFYLSGKSQVFSARVDGTTPPVALFQIPPWARSAAHGLLAFDVSPDGNRFLVPTVSSQESHSIVVVRNWEAALLPKH